MEEVKVSIGNMLVGKCVGCELLSMSIRTEILSNANGGDQHFVFIDCEHRKVCDSLEKKFCGGSR